MKLADRLYVSSSLIFIFTQIRRKSVGLSLLLVLSVLFTEVSCTTKSSKERYNRFILNFILLVSEGVKNRIFLHLHTREFE
jgi:hypothetical protein